MALLAAGCDTDIARPPEVALRVGYDTLDGALEVWPARGGLITDPATTSAVATAVERWRAPTEDRVHLPSSGIIWLGEADGAPLALVAANVPGQSASWLLQLTGNDTGFEVSHGVEYTDPGYLVYADLLPLRLTTGRHYLASTRVERVLGPDGEPITFTDGLSAPVEIPPCTAVTITVRLRSTESLPAGRPSDKLLDLGLGTAAPKYPLVIDESGAGEAALAGLDTCAMGERTGAFGSIPYRYNDRNDWDSVPMSWPIGRLEVKPLAEIPFGADPSTELQQLTWRSDDGTMTAVVVRGADGSAVASPADRLSPLQTYELPVPGERPVVVLVWRAATESTLAAPLGTVRRVDRPGLMVVEKPTTRETFSLATPDKTTQRTVGGKD